MPPQPFPLIYHDGESLFLEFPTVALRFPFTEGGLHKALRHIPNVAKATGYVARRGNIADRVLPKLAKATKTKREIQNFSVEQRAAASAAIRKLKVGD